MKIQKIEAENFKLFSEKFQDVEKIGDTDLILFNGRMAMEKPVSLMYWNFASQERSSVFFSIRKNLRWQKTKLRKTGF